MPTVHDDALEPPAGPTPAHVARLGLLATRLLPALTVRDVVDAVTAAGAEELGADAVTVYLLDGAGTSLRLSGRAGYDGGLPLRFEVISLSHPLPVVEALQRRQPVVYATVADRDARYPELAGYASASASAVIAPLCLPDGRALGILSVGWHDERPMATGVVAFAQAAARACAQAVDRARRHDLAHRELESVRFLSEATRAVNETLDLEPTLQALAHLPVPALADVCAVCLADDDGTLRPVAVVTDDPDRQAVLDELVAQRPVVTNPVLLAVAATGTSRLVRSVDPTPEQVDVDDEAPRALLQALDATSGLAVAIRPGHGAAGVVLWLMTGDRAPLEESALHLAEQLADRAAGAIEHALQFSALDRRANGLEHALESRIVIEQAKGMLAVRWDVDVDTAFAHLRAHARTSRRRIHDLAAEVVAGTGQVPGPADPDPAPTGH